MAISIDWESKIINVPSGDLLLIQSSPTYIYQLDLDAFRLELKDLEDSVEGMPFLDTHSHNTTVTVGGVTLARVIEIINGYTVTFEDGQYAVNLVGANSNVADVVNVNQVSVRSANSAGLTYSDAINKQSFLDATVFIDTEDGLPGTAFPRGTPSDPVSNYTDARVIATANNFESFSLEGSIYLTGENLFDEDWDGRGALHSAMFMDGISVSGTNFHNMLLQGTVATGGGNMIIDNCLIGGLSGLRGSLKESQITGPIYVCPCYSGIISFNFCASHIPGSNTPIYDFNSAPCDAEFRFYAGGMELRNFNQGKSMSIDMVAGHVKIADSCTSGNIIIRGSCRVTDLTTGSGITINTDYATNIQIDKVQKNTSLIPATL